MTAKQRFRSAAARFHFSDPPVRYHHPGKPGLLPETIPVNPRSRFDELPAPTQQAIAQLDNPQVRPCCRPKAQYLSGDVGGGSAGIRCATVTLPQRQANGKNRLRSELGAACGRLAH